jgi:acyl-CoA reductase-like NAD-dependent aldehyde dehydrogenase
MLVATASELPAVGGKLLIGGDWLDAEDHSVDIDPSTGEELSRIARGTVGDVKQATAAAQRAQPAWAAMPASARGKILFDAADELAADADAWATLMAREMGKPIAEARAECLRAAAILRYHAGEAHRPIGEHYASDTGTTWLFTRREPVGVVGVITPWNFPAAIPTWKLAPALVHGNTVVLKPAGEAALTGLRLVSALVKAGVPAGVLNVVLGPGGELGAAIVEHPDIAAVSFTGSTLVGREVIAKCAALGKRVQAEMGGHNPAIVRADAHLVQALDAVALGAFASAGQKCTATRRVYVARELYDDFVLGLSQRAKALRVGAAVEPETQMGPLAGSSHLRDVMTEVKAAAVEAELVTGGGRLNGDGHARGAFMAPTVFANVHPASKLATQEVFGPVVAVWPMDGDDQPIKLANRTSYGLSASIFTRDLNWARAFVEGVRAGIVHVNSQTAGAEVHVPFGGLGISSYGPHEQGRSAIDFYTQDKTVYLDPTAEL